MAEPLIPLPHAAAQGANARGGTVGTRPSSQTRGCSCQYHWQCPDIPAGAVGRTPPGSDPSRGEAGHTLQPTPCVECFEFLSAGWAGLGFGSQKAQWPEPLNTRGSHGTADHRCCRPVPITAGGACHCPGSVPSRVSLHATLFLSGMCMHSICATIRGNREFRASTHRGPWAERK